MRRNILRILSAGLAVCLLASSVLAAPPRVSYDEALYVNLDYYGATQAESVVKGCSLNGVREFTDYGAYSQIINMSNHVEPVLTDEGVTWKLPDDVKERFYFECVPEQGHIKLPWTFDVSYKLDGVPVQAEKLAGADGLVEINVACTANPEAADYYRNNMLLQVLFLADMESTLSLDAPGSQTQSLGTYKVSIFAALPGESTTFTVRIGTEDFESPGIVMMMIPGTLEQMKDIKTLKAAKDLLGDSAESLYGSVNQLLNLMGNLYGGMGVMQDGLKDLQSARDALAKNKDSVSASADDALANLSALSDSLGSLLPKLDGAKGLANDVHAAANTIDQAGSALKAPLEELRGNLTDVRGSLQELRDGLADGSFDEEGFRKALKSLKSHFTALNDTLEDLNDELDTLERALNSSDNLFNTLSSLAHEASKAMSLLQDSALSQIFPELADVAATLQLRLTLLSNDLYAAGRAALRFLDLGRDILSEIGNLSSSAALLIESLDAFSDYDVTDGLNRAADHMDALIATLDQALERTTSLVDALGSITALIDDHHQAALDLIDDVKDTGDKLTNTLNASNAFLKSSKAALQSGSASLDSGTQKTLDGLIDVLDKALGSSRPTDSMRDTNDTIKDTVDEQMDKVEGETNFLNLDAESKIISFTSSQNNEPDSIQVILRTAEITRESVQADDGDLEQPEADEGFWGRVANVFKKIWQSITSIFS